MYPIQEIDKQIKDPDIQNYAYKPPATFCFVVHVRFCCIGSLLSLDFHVNSLKL